jgi:hypothetical protein
MQTRAGLAPDSGDMRPWNERANEPFDRIVRSMNGQNLDLFAHFWRTCPSREQKAMLWALGNS